MRDLHNSIHPVVAITPRVVTDDTASVSAQIDRYVSERYFDSLEFLILLGTLSDANATFAVTGRHANVSDWSDAEALTDAMLLGTLALAGGTFADDDEAKKLGYIGDKRYVEITITPTGNTGNIPLAALALLGHPSITPTANPPQ